MRGQHLQLGPWGGLLSRGSSHPNWFPQRCRAVVAAGRAIWAPTWSGVTHSWVPTHAMEILEFAAARAAIERGELESRTPLDKPLDVLVQHLVTAAMADGFREEELKAEVRGSWSYRNLTDDEWQWAMQFVRHGGDALSVYPEFSRIASKGERYEVTSKLIARRHRMNIGTITADDAVAVAYRTGKRLGFIEETFISRLRPGDRFVFAGKMLRFKRVREMTAIVEKASGTRGVVPRWNGGRMPLSTQLAKCARGTQCVPRAEIGPPRATQFAAAVGTASRTQSNSHPTCLFGASGSGPKALCLPLPYAGRLAHEGLGAYSRFGWLGNRQGRCKRW